jgi:hypothetical protein
MIEIELTDLTEDAVRRLLKDAIRQQSVNSLPAHRRGKAKQSACGCCGKPSCDCDCPADDENSTKVAMNRGGTSPNLPGVKGDDLPPGMDLARYKGRTRGKVS